MMVMNAVKAGKTRLATAERIKRVLVAAQAERKQRQGEAYDECDRMRTQEWVLYERRAVLAEVNAIRREQAFPPIDELTLFLKAEVTATGHVDYTSKYALYAAELALMETP